MTKEAKEKFYAQFNLKLGRILNQWGVTDLVQENPLSGKYTASVRDKTIGLFAHQKNGRIGIRFFIPDTPKSLRIYTKWAVELPANITSEGAIEHLDKFLMYWTTAQNVLRIHSQHKGYNEKAAALIRETRKQLEDSKGLRLKIRFSQDNNEVHLDAESGFNIILKKEAKTWELHNIKKYYEDWSYKTSDFKIQKEKLRRQLNTLTTFEPYVAQLLEELNKL